MSTMPILKRPCSNCPFRSDGEAIELRPGRLDAIVSDLLADDTSTFACHKTLDGERKTCAGAVAVMSKLGRLPVIARIAIAFGELSASDIAACAEMVIDSESLDLTSSKA